MVVLLQRDKIPIPVLCSENLFLTNRPLWLAKNSSQDSFMENSCQLKKFWFINQTADRNWAGNSLEWVVWSNAQTFPMVWTVSVFMQPLIFCLWLHSDPIPATGTSWDSLPRSVKCSFSPTKISTMGGHRSIGLINGKIFILPFIICFYSCCIFVNSIQLVTEKKCLCNAKGRSSNTHKKESKVLWKKGKNRQEMQIYPVFFQNHVNCSPKSQLCFLQQDYFKLWNPESIRKYLAWFISLLIQKTIL